MRSVGRFVEPLRGCFIGSQGRGCFVPGSAVLITHLLEDLDKGIMCSASLGEGG